jgi:integrase
MTPSLGSQAIYVPPIFDWASQHTDVDEEGAEIFPRKWNHNAIGMPLIVRSEQNTPCFSPKVMSGLAKWEFEPEQTLFSLCGGSGLRVPEALALKIEKHVSVDFLTLTIKSVKSHASARQVDLHSSIAVMLKKLVGERKSGFLFCSSKGTALNASCILRNHLHPALKQLGYINPYTHDHKAGTPAFRRFRRAYLMNRTCCPQGLQKFWMGAADTWMHSDLDKGHEDTAYRKTWAEKCGLGFELPPAAPGEPEVEGDQNGNKAA